MGLAPTAVDGGDNLSGTAMDSAEVLNEVKAEARQEVVALFAAREEVKPLVGVIAMDSALDTAEGGKGVQLMSHQQRIRPWLGY